MNSIPLTRKLRRLTAELDAIVSTSNAKREELPVTCSKGCSACCSLLSLSLNVEGINIAEFLLSDERSLLLLPSLIDSLVVGAKEADYPEMTHGSFFSKNIPCAFLKDNQCSIYERRPAACRYHFSVSDPKNCSPDHPTGEIMRLDLLWAEDAVSEWNYEATRDPTPSPIAISVLWALDTFVKGRHPVVATLKPELIAKIREAARSVSNPYDWIKTHLTRLQKEQMFRPATEEEMDEEGRRNPD